MCVYNSSDSDLVLKIEIVALKFDVKNFLNATFIERKYIKYVSVQLLL